MPEAIPLTPHQAACLEALRTGSTRKSLIALKAGVTSSCITRALYELAARGLATLDVRKWRLTHRGRTVDISVGPAVRRGRKPGRKRGTSTAIGAAAARLLAALDQPRRGAELMQLLGVTRQRIHQLVVRLIARGLIRSADPNFPTFVTALRDDPSLLLRPDQERVLSAFPATAATTLSKLAKATNMPAAKVATIAASLHAARLIERAGTATFGDLYRLSAAGTAHWQRSTAAPHADPPPLPFRSDRVRAVLTYLEREGPVRSCDVGVALGIPQPTINALMQYLKRKSMVRTVSGTYNAQHELTPEGRAMLAAMQHEAATPPHRSKPGHRARHGENSLAMIGG